VATQFRDMPLGGTSGFASQYTPIRFAPLVSLTGPIAARPQPAAAPEEQMMRPQMPLMDQSGFGTGDESQGLPYAGGPSIGSRSADQTRGDLMNIGGFLMSPIGSMLNYAMTGQKPGEALQAMVDSFRGQTPSGAQGGGFGFQNPFAGLANWFSGKVFGPEEVSLSQSPLSSQSQGGVSSIGGIGGAVYNDTFNNVYSMTGDPQLAAKAANEAAGLFGSQQPNGIPIDGLTAITMATQNAMSSINAMSSMNAPFAGVPTSTQVSAPQGAPGFSPLTPDFLTEYGTPIPLDTLGRPVTGVTTTPISSGGDVSSSTGFGFDPGGVGAPPASAAAGMGPGW
jgi:hypothetical protein